MNILISIVKKIKGRKCEKLVKQTGKEIKINGPSFGIGEFKMDVGKYSDEIKEFYKVTQVTIALDQSQYLLCSEISNLREGKLKDDLIRIRLQLILSFNQLQAILGSIGKGPTDELSKELAKWVRYMSKLNIESIMALQPKPRMFFRGGTSELSLIMKYQGIDENEMNEALKVMR